MNFFNSLLPSLKIWRLFGLSPFALEPFSTSNINRNQDRIQIIRILIFILLSILAITANALYAMSIGDLWIHFWIVFARISGLSTSIIILIESSIKRESQVKWLIQLNSISSFIVDQIGIQIDYTAEHQRHTKRLNRWKTINTMIFILNTFLLLVANNVYLGSTFLFMSYAFNMHSFRFHQYVTYVDLIKHRYGLINEFINKIYLNDFNQLLRQEELIEDFYFLRKMIIMEVEEYRQPVNKFKLICQLRHASTLLTEASHRLNDLFSVSLTICIFRLFCQLIGNTYFMFEIATTSSSWVAFLVAVFEILPIGNEIISMANACEDATEEVLKFPFFLLKQDLHNFLHLTGKEIQRIYTQTKLQFI